MSIFLRFCFRWFLDVVYPRHCLICREHLSVHSHYRYICSLCYDTLPWVQYGNHCDQCGGLFRGEIDGLRRCPQCIELNPRFLAGRTFFAYEAGAREWVHTLKYHQGRYLLPDIRLFLRKSSHLCDFLAHSTLVPVPLHAKRLRQRGYNQSQLLAKIWSQEVEGTDVQDILIRVLSTPSQVNLTREERLRNVKKAFAIRSKMTLDPLRTYTVIDDVYTTGATLSACADTLYRAGARRIQILTLAHG